MNLRALQQFANDILGQDRHTDSMNDYYPHQLWLDTDTGTFGNAATLVMIDTTDWTQEDCDTWECMTDSERNDYGIEYSTHNGQCLNPLEYQRETGSDNQ